jgi:hypothetical protein
MVNSKYNSLRYVRDSIWTIRRGCLEGISEIAEVFNTKEASDELVTIVYNSLQDTNKWVVREAMKQIGPLLFQLKKNSYFENMNETLLNIQKFLSNYENFEKKDELAYNLAYNFPSILNAYGRESWPIFRNSYIQASKELDIKIRTSIASSFFTIASILKQEEGAEEYLSELLSVIRTYLTEIPTIVIKILPQIPDLLKIYPLSQIVSEIINLFV